MKTKIAKSIGVALGLFALSACGKTNSSNSPTPRVHTMSAGIYEQRVADGSTDILIINQDNSMSLELTRQVGGPGGISNEGVVPYETVCRVKQIGVVVSERNDEIEYEVRSVELSDLTGLRNTEYCAEYVRAFTSLIPRGIRFSLKISDYGLRPY